MHVANTEMGQVGNNVGQGAKDGQTLCFVVVGVCLISSIVPKPISPKPFVSNEKKKRSGEVRYQSLTTSDGIEICPLGLLCWVVP